MITPLPLTREKATEILREISEDSSRWIVLMKYPDHADWRRIVNRRQIQLCLQEGYILDDRARLDEHKNWRFSIARVCGGLNVVIDVALEASATLPKLYVLGINGDNI